MPEGRGTTRETRDPRARMSSGLTLRSNAQLRRALCSALAPAHKRCNMTGNPPDEGTPAPTTPNYAALIEEQKQIIVKMSEQLKALEQKSAAQEAKITALSQPAAAPAAPAMDPAAAKLAAAKAELDRAYDQVLKDFGFSKKE